MKIDCRLKIRCFLPKSLLNQIFIEPQKIGCVDLTIHWFQSSVIIHDSDCGTKEIILLAVLRSEEFQIRLILKRMSRILDAIVSQWVNKIVWPNVWLWLMCSSSKHFLCFKTIDFCKDIYSPLECKWNFTIPSHQIIIARELFSSHLKLLFSCKW